MSNSVEEPPRPFRHVSRAMFLAAIAAGVGKEDGIAFLLLIANPYWWGKAQGWWMTLGGKGDIRPEGKRATPIPKEYEE